MIKIIIGSFIGTSLVVVACGCLLIYFQNKTKKKKVVNIKRKY